MPRITYFQAPSFGLCNAEFESTDTNSVTKRALVMVEGDHIDSAKRHHIFGADRIHRIVENTNNFLATGGRVPWQVDHKKTQDANIGDLEGGLEARVITIDDLPNPNLRHLIGKVGAFAERLVAKGADIVNLVYEGRIKTLSPGIDVKDDLIREISATPTPAIVGLSTFSQARFALTMDDAEAENDQSDAAKEQFEEIGEKFWSVVNSIYSATEDDLQGQDQQSLLMQAVQDYCSRVSNLIGVGNGQQQDSSMGMPMQQPGMGMGVPGTQLPNYLPQQQGFSPPGMAKMHRGSGRRVLAAFSMSEMEKLIPDRAEFLFDFQVKKKDDGLVSGAAKVGALAAGGAAAIRYGGAALKKGNLAMKVAPSITGAANGFMGGAKAFTTGAGFGLRNKIGSDLSKAGSAIAGTSGVKAREAVGGALKKLGNVASTGGGLRSAIKSAFK